MQFRDVRLDAIMEAREHLLIRIDIMESGERGREAELAQARQELADLNAEIEHHRPKQV